MRDYDRWTLLLGFLAAVAMFMLLGCYHPLSDLPVFYEFERLPGENIDLYWHADCGKPPPDDVVERARAALLERRHDCDPATVSFDGVEVVINASTTAYGGFHSRTLVASCATERPWYDNIPWEARNLCCAITGSCDPS